MIVKYDRRRRNTHDRHRRPHNGTVINTAPRTHKPPYPPPSRPKGESGGGGAGCVRRQHSLSSFPPASSELTNPRVIVPLFSVCRQRTRKFIFFFLFCVCCILTIIVVVGVVTNLLIGLI